MKAQFDPSFDVDDLAWVRRLWPGKLVVKGVLDPQDARIAVEAGADAVLVSNHGGRQLDGASSTARAFPAIRDAVGDRTELFFDSGIRSGLDVLKALGLGARACFIGRAYLYGLGAGGEAGVAKALIVIRDGLDTGMALTGTTDVRVRPPDVIVNRRLAAGRTGERAQPQRRADGRWERAPCGREAERTLSSERARHPRRVTRAPSGRIRTVITDTPGLDPKALANGASRPRSTARSASTPAAARSTPPTPRTTARCRSASSSRGRATTSSRTVAICRALRRADPAARRRHQPRRRSAATSPW